MIHIAGKFANGIQCCSICGEILFRQDKIDPKTYVVPTRLVSVKSSTTKKVVISSNGWTEGICLDVSAHKTEVTTRKPNCHGQIKN